MKYKRYTKVVTKEFLCAIYEPHPFRSEAISEAVGKSVDTGIPDDQWAWQRCPILWAVRWSRRLSWLVYDISGFWDLIKDKCDIKGRGGYSLQYVYPIIVSEFDLPDNVKYDNDYERDCGFCSNSDKEILTRIKKLIKECSNGLFGGCSKENWWIFQRMHIIIKANNNAT